MRADDFGRWGIKNFTADEVLGTGAPSLDGVSWLLMYRLQRFRTLIGRRVALLPGGLTSGSHKSVLHPDGYAVDVAFCEGDGPVSSDSVRACAQSAGFGGIGVYWNDVAYSVHLDLRPTLTHWMGYKAHGTARWAYRNGNGDPKEMAV